MTPYHVAYLRALERAMQAAGTTQDEVATAAGVHRTSLNRWLRGHTTPKKRSLRSLEAGARSLGLEVRITRRRRRPRRG